jgi:hypothetical protein
MVNKSLKNRGFLAGIRPFLGIIRSLFRDFERKKRLEGQSAAGFPAKPASNGDLSEARNRDLVSRFHLAESKG